MASNTTYNPQNIRDFEKSKISKDARGVLGTAAAGGTTNIDLVMGNDVLITGGVFLAQGAAWGDTVDFQVVHPQAGVVAQFITAWCLDPTSVMQQLPTASYPAKLATGLTLRVVYHSIGGTAVDVGVNYNLERVLV